MGQFGHLFINSIDAGDGGGGGDAGGDAGASGGDAGAGGDGSGDAGAAGDSGAASGDAGDGSASGAASGDNGDGAASNYFGTMPEDWRKQAVTSMGYAEDSDDYTKAMKQLDRVSDMGVFTKNYLSAQEKIRTGEISNGLPENATEEQIADYREANGVPATAADYQLTLDEGLVLGKGDEKIMGGIYEIAHASNVSSEVMSQMTNAMLVGRQAEADERLTQDGIDQQTTNQQLKDTWGGDLTANVNMVSGLVALLPESVKEQFENARLPSGKAIFNSPEMMIAMADWARKINPSATVVPNSSNPVADINSELASLKAKMGTSEWSKDKEGQARYMALLTAKENMSMNK